MLSSLLALLVTAVPFTTASPADVALFRTRAQAMLDAVQPGDRKTWDALLAPEAFSVDENGVIQSRKEILDGITPLPAGIHSTLTMPYFQVHLDGDTAFVIHQDEEKEDFHGDLIVEEFLTTETWIKRKGEWRIAFFQVHAINKDPPLTHPSAASLEAYVGTYTTGRDLTYVISRAGEGLVGGRPGSKSHPLGVELTDVLFTVGQPRTRKIFQRDAHGRVLSFVDRREGLDILWKRH